MASQTHFSGAHGTCSGSSASSVRPKGSHRQGRVPGLRSAILQAPQAPGKAFLLSIPLAQACQVYACMGARKRAWACACVHGRVRACRGACVRGCGRGRMGACMGVCVRAGVHGCMRARVRHGCIGTCMGVCGRAWVCAWVRVWTRGCRRGRMDACPACTHTFRWVHFITGRGDPLRFDSGYSLGGNEEWG